MQEWRIANINALISGTYSKIKSINKDIQFGISPQCNIDNNIKMGADVYSWGSKKGYVDYLCPQLYINFNHNELPFDIVFNNWKNIVTDKNVKLYVGLALYKANSDSDKGTWKYSDCILKSQINYCRNQKCDGFMLYPWSFLENSQTINEIKNLDTCF